MPSFTPNGLWLQLKPRAFGEKAQQDVNFLKRVERVTVAYIPDFGLAACLMIMRLNEYKTSLVIDLNSKDAEDFAMMTAMGFFRDFDCRYQMVVPCRLGPMHVGQAVLKYAKTEDKEFALHPEYLATAIPLAAARTHQIRLRALDDFPHTPHLGRT